MSKNINILIIEDLISPSKTINTIFEESGFKTYFCYSIEESKQIISEIKIDYIILDINLPDGNGFELISELRNKAIKIIVLTSEENMYIKNIAYQKGIIDFIDRNKNFLYKISEIPNLIKQIEKNKNKNILILDKSSSSTEKLKEILKNRNYNVLNSTKIEEVLNIIEINKIDLIFLDLQIDSNAYDFLIENRNKIFKELKIKVVILTENIEDWLLRDAFRLGVREILQKPYSIEELILKTDIFINDKDIEDEMINKTQLLNQYKDTVDRSSIVSKTNAKGIITYANEAFCKISGYEEKELLGKPHNIVRDPDFDSSIFKQMWHTIKALKKPWNGIVKNRKKDGSCYWVQTIINPILDKNQNVLEYIGIRTDITEIEKTKEYLKDQYDISQNNFEEIVNLSKLYENAIEQSNLILRLDKNRIITYADKEFYEISGFTKEDLIGKHYDRLNRVCESYKVEQMWEELSKGNIWKGQISNVFKDNKTHHFLATVVPIINLSGEILEYMSIRKEITDVIELHKEIEETQGEIIYKMGEIGESRSNETGNHVKRVAHYSKLLARLYGLEEKECDILFTASPMHDIGKVGVPDSILNKNGKLTFEEFEIMKEHVTIGYNILKNSKREILKAAAIVSIEHHEKWDGSGYPFGLKGEEIHIYGRITAIADVFDALGSHRSYKKAWDDEKIFELLEDEKGKHFDPKLIDLFFENINEFKNIRKRYRDLTND